VGLTQVVTLDTTLGVGGLQDAVTVIADAPLLAVATAEVGTTMKNSVVTDLPLSVSGGRSLENFAYASPPAWRGQLDVADCRRAALHQGGRARRHVRVIQIGGHIGESSPPMESVEEFKVLTSGIAAEYGRTGGASSTSPSSRAPTHFGAPPMGTSGTRR